MKNRKYWRFIDEVHDASKISSRELTAHVRKLAAGDPVRRGHPTMTIAAMRNELLENADGAVLILEDVQLYPAGVLELLEYAPDAIYVVATVSDKDDWYEPVEYGPYGERLN